MFQMVLIVCWNVGEFILYSLGMKKVLLRFFLFPNPFNSRILKKLVYPTVLSLSLSVCAREYCTVVQRSADSAVGRGRVRNSCSTEQ